MALYQRSLEIMKGAQAPSGAFVACANFPTYRFSWFRDSAFVGYALDLAGEHERVHRFHQWAAEVVLRHREEARAGIEAGRRGEIPSRFLRARYTLEGEEDQAAWGDYQLDGLGTWLWSVREHLRRAAARPLDGWQEAIELVVAYLGALWRLPCHDLWEEFSDRRHTYTLAAIVGGLEAVADLVSQAAELAGEVRDHLLAGGRREGLLAKFLDGPAGVDGCLVGLGTPYGVVEPDHPGLGATLERIEADLRGPTGGILRYPEDTYYGGGEWILLTAWLGWHRARAGDHQAAREAAAWVEAQAHPETLDLPEQVAGQRRNPQAHAEWVARWGPVATPLTWSHAMYVILRHALAS